MHSRILLLQTGGTLDSEPYPDPYHPPQHVKTLKGDASFLMPMLKSIQGHEQVDRFTWTGDREDRLNKDSKEFTPKDIEELAGIIRRDAHQHFILTHGTDAAVRNAEQLEKALAGSGKTVAFVSCMVPLSMHEQHASDAIATLGFAIENIHNQPPGVYIAGRDAGTRRLAFFTPQTVEKDWELSRKDLQFTLKQR